MPAPIYRRTRDTFLWVLAIPIILGLLSFWSGSEYRRSIGWTLHTQEVLLGLKDLRITLGEIGGNQRGYLLTGEESYLERYARATGQLSSALAQLGSLTADNPRQRANVQQLTAAVRAHTQRLEQTLTLRYRGSLPGPDVPAAMREQAVTGTRIRAITDAMGAEENKLLGERTRRQQGFEIEVAVLFAFGIATSVLLLYFSSRVIQQYGAEREQAETEVHKLNDELHLRIEQRTAELKEANERLSRSNRDLTQFAYVASHDLQEPLRTVGSYAGLLGRRYEGRLDEQADKYIRFIVDGAKRMQTLVQDLLAYSRVGTQAVKLELTDLNVVLQQVRENLRLALAERNASLIFDTLPAAICDGTKVGQIFQNLIANSLKFRKPDEPPRISITAKLDQLEYVLSVSDNGIGFDPKYAERIFVIFQRLHQLGAYPGNGIGLAICQRLVEAHGGRIWAESKPGVGSTFQFTLPGTLFTRAAGSDEATNGAGAGRKDSLVDRS